MECKTNPPSLSSRIWICKERKEHSFWWVQRKSSILFSLFKFLNWYFVFWILLQRHPPWGLYTKKENLSSLENLQISKDKKVVKDICFSTFLCFWFFSPDFFTNTGHTKNENVFVKKSCEISLIKESFLKNHLSRFA